MLLAAACGRPPAAAAWRHNAANEAPTLYFSSLTFLTAAASGRVSARQRSSGGRVAA